MNTETKYTNLDYLRLMADGDEEMVQTMLGMLLEELPEEVEKIKQLNQEQDWAELSKVSHKLKSTLAFVGNEVMANANKEIELLSKNNEDLHRIASLLETLETYLPPVLAELKQHLP